MNNVNQDLLNKLNTILTSRRISLNEKKRLLNLKRIYIRNRRLNDITKTEKELYKNKSSTEKIYFEIRRIEMFLSQPKDNPKIQELLKIIKSSISKSNGHNYNLIFKSLITIEVELGMGIGLLKEFDDYFVDEVDYYYSRISNEIDLIEN